MSILLLYLLLFQELLKILFVVLSSFFVPRLSIHHVFRFIL
jgi:hypothetical protein